MMRFSALWLVLVGLTTGAVYSWAGGERYHNETWNFCVDYPKGWQASHPVDEYAIAFHRGNSVSMSFGVIKDNESLEENFRTAYLDKGVSITKKESTTFRGRPAIIATITGGTPPGSAQHIVTVAATEGVIYEFQISASDIGTLDRFLLVFQAELNSFKFNCR